MAARRASEKRFRTSLDLGLTQVEVSIRDNGVDLPDGESIEWETLQEIAESQNNCFIIENDTARKIMRFSEETNRLYALMPTQGAPTMLVSGIPMHRIKDTEPYRDTREKIKTLQPLRGQVLDTATGLGYTAIEASRSADLVITIELDPAVLEIARLNPWSRGLFDNPQIEQRIGDTFDVIIEMADASFSYVIHDPPAFSLAGHLYSAEFYSELHRVLRDKGRIFHYVGSPESRSGRNITRGVSERLRQVGFSRVRTAPAAFGVVAYK